MQRTEKVIGKPIQIGDHLSELSGILTLTGSCIEGSKYSRCICENTTGIDAVLPIRSKSYIWLERL